MRETGKLKTREWYDLGGLCYSDRKVYTVEWRALEHVDLAVYQMNSDSGSLILMDCMDLEIPPEDMLCMWETQRSGRLFSPSIDRHSHRVFLPVLTSVLVVRLEGDKLVKERILHSVGQVLDLAVIPLDTLYVRDGWAVHLVDGIHDTVTGTLEKPALANPYPRPCSVTVQGDNIVVCYGTDVITLRQSEFSRYSQYSLAIYRHGSLTPIRVLHAPNIHGEWNRSHLLTAESEGHVLLLSRKNATVCVININENVFCVNHEINVNTGSDICDCTVVNSQLWVACDSGDIIIMSSRKSQKESLLNKIV